MLYSSLALLFPRHKTNSAEPPLAPGTFKAQSRSVFLLLLLLVIRLSPLQAQNPIVAENQLPGTPGWNVNGLGDTTIMGFATDISVNKGSRVNFKIKTNAAAYRIEIYRIGYYQGIGGRLVGTGTVTAGLPQVQPKGIYQPETGLLDCGNWAVSGYWDVPANAVSGVYTAKLIRTDNNGSQQILFIVRDDASTSDLLFQTSDATWQAYNTYGDSGPGNSFYQGNVPNYNNGRATKISYNRPFLASIYDKDFLFRAEYAMIRWLERNGYNVSYFTNIDSDRYGNLIKNHKAFLSVGHDEYWSATHRANIEAARNSGVNLAFLSANTCYWKTRWENAVDGSGTTHRTLVCYKEGTDGSGTCGTKCDPLPNVWTGTWRSGCQYNADGCRPENDLIGQISYWATGKDESIQVPASYKGFRFWRNTPVASLTSGQTVSLLPNLGFEFDYENSAYRLFNPAGRVRMSESVFEGGNITHQLALYRHSSGALVFGAGSIDWSLGLETDLGSGSIWGATTIPDPKVQQATVNILADMGAQPSTLQAGIVAAAAITDRQPPVSTITSPANGATVSVGTPITIQGTAAESAGVVAGFELSTDGGTTWQPVNSIVPATSTNWSIEWTPPTAGVFVIKTRAVDDMGNMEIAVTASNTIQVSTDGVVPTPPTITCPANATANTDAGKCSATLSFSATANGFPAPSLSYTVGGTAINFPYTFPAGTTTVLAIASNGTLPNASCSFTVTVNDNIAPKLTAPANLSLSQSSNDLYVIPPAEATDNCGIPVVSYAITGATNRTGTGKDASGTFNVGTSTITWTVKDVSGNTGSATTTVVISTASQPIVLTCPANINVNTEAGKCNAQVSFAATATGSPAPSVVYTIGSTVISSPYSFQKGTTTVTATASNGVLPSVSCSFTVTVTDSEAPKVTPPAAVEQVTNPSGSYTIPPVTATDNCGVQSYSYAITGATNRTGTGQNASGTFNVGTSTVTWTVKDVSGNTGSATTTVIIKVPTSQAPTITCPADIKVITTKNSSNVNFAATATGIPTPVITYRIGSTRITSPYTFPNGTTVVTATASNGILPDATCTFTVSVKGKSQTAINQATTTGLPSNSVAFSMSDALQLQAVPNPFQQFFTLSVRSNSNAPVAIRVFDMAGREIDSKTSVAVGSLLRIGQGYSPGVYVIEAAQEGRKTTLKLVRSN